MNMKGILLTNKWSGLSTEVPVSWPQKNQGYLGNIKFKVIN